jgi:hypothetical protein
MPTLHKPGVSSSSLISGERAGVVSPQPAVPFRQVVTDAPDFVVAPGFAPPPGTESSGGEQKPRTRPTKSGLNRGTCASRRIGQTATSRLVPVIAHAVAVFGDERKATHWLSTPLPLLKDRSPADLLFRASGIKQVEQILTRIEHNIPS